MNLVLYTAGDRSFYCTAPQAEALDCLTSMKNGSIGSVTGYQPSASKYEVRPTYDVQVITGYNMDRLYERRIAALEAVTYSDVAEAAAKEPKLSALTAAKALEHFNDRKAMLMGSLATTLNGDRSDARRQGHDRCYIHVSQGVKVNLDCEKDADGIMQPKLHNGLPIAESIMLMVLELRRTYTVKGKRKAVNSGAPVLMGNLIEKCLNSRSVGIKAISLKVDNFTGFKCSGQTITAEDLQGVDLASEYRILLEGLGFAFV